MGIIHSRGFSVTIVVPTGQSDGLRNIEKSNWDGIGVICPRSLFKTAKNEHEFNRPGVYLLVGPAPDSDLRQVYIGEGDPIVDRLKEHFLKKDFWTVLVAFTSSRAGALNKAHIQHLEARLLKLAKEAKRCVIDQKSMELPTLSKRDEIEAEGFLEEVLLCLPLLGLDMFEKAPQATASEHFYFIKAKGIEAAGFEHGQGFVVRKGSTVVVQETASIHGYLAALRSTLREKGVITEQGGGWVFAEDYTFDSPSTAAGVVQGRTANGRIDWKDTGGKTLKAVQSEGALTAEESTSKAVEPDSKTALQSL